MMQLGAFSISLAVKDLATSKAFYAKLGFDEVAGDGTSYQIMRNGDTTIGLFQGMFEGNILTFNPGWDAHCNPLDDFEDVRRIRESLATDGIELISDTTADSESGPASLMLTDPDGNTILIDQHVG